MKCHRSGLQMDRLSWIDYFMLVVDAISQRSTCDRGKPGCVFTKNNQILATGYAGAPPGFPHCSEVGHQMEEHIQYKDQVFPIDVILNSNYIFKERYEKKPTQHCVRTLHAENNAIIQAAKRGIALEGSTVYVSFTPCERCAMMLVSIGVEKVICKKLYHKAAESIEIFKRANIEIIHLENEVQTYNI